MGFWPLKNLFSSFGWIADKDARKLKNNINGNNNHSSKKDREIANKINSSDLFLKQDSSLIYHNSSLKSVKFTPFLKRGMLRRNLPNRDTDTGNNDIELNVIDLPDGNVKISKKNTEKISNESNEVSTNFQGDVNIKIEGDVNLTIYEKKSVFTNLIDKIFKIIFKR